MKFFAQGKRRWWVFLLCGLVVATAGLWLGKTHEGKYIDRYYTHTDFMLLDADGEFFRLKKDIPESKLLLLILTPDGLDPAVSIPFRGFSSHLDDFHRRGVEVMMLTRTNREIAKNFRAAAHFHGRLLLDPSSTVGRQLGIWASNAPTNLWGYVLIDNHMEVYWRTAEKTPLTYEQVSDQLKAMK